MNEHWMFDDVHECPLSSHEHRADAECVAYARQHGDRRFVDYCGGPVYSPSGGGYGGIDGRCCEPALHDGPCAC